MRSLILAGALVALPACATTDGADRIAAMDVALTQVEARFAAARSVALLFAPWLPPRQSARLNRLADIAALAITAARAATEAAARQAALRRAAMATDRYRAAAGG